MRHWQKYIDRQRSEYLQKKLREDFAADIVVVIPCFDEPDICTTLRSLKYCVQPHCNTLVVTVVNSSERAPHEVVMRNRETYHTLQLFAESESNHTIRFCTLLFENLPRKHAGVGLARKIGMDLAVDYFLRTQNPNGVIASLDADCLVSENYLSRINTVFSRNEKLCVTVFDFHHRVCEENPQLENAIRQYEQYIRYFSNALEFTGFPYYFHTIGSAFAVRADAYVRVGGIGRQQGGEDFYFLQKTFVFEQTRIVSEVQVQPLARISDRIPFGTGPALQKIMQSPERALMAYAFESFDVLKSLFDKIECFYGKDSEDLQRRIARLHPAICQFSEENKLLHDIEDCNKNAASLVTFRKRFFHHFNAFRIIKYLNFAERLYFPNENIDVCVDKLQKTIGG